MSLQVPKSSLLTILYSILLLISCSKNSEDPNTNPNTPNQSQSFEISGSVSKGSFVAGSSLTFFEIDDELNQTGRSFSTNIDDDFGNYELSATGIAEAYARVTGEGFYWNEVTNENTQNRISLVALSKFNNSINVNILTHMEADRVRYLYLEEGLTFDESKEQALNEILEAFDISSPINLTNAEEFSFVKGDETSKILLVLSAVIQGNRSVSEVSVLLSKLALEFKNNGNIVDQEIIDDIAGQLRFLDKENLIQNVLNKYSRAYPNLTAESFQSSYLDSIKKPNGKFLSDLDLDGITDDIDQCPDSSPGEAVSSTGCAESQLDTDQDGITDDIDQCENTDPGLEVNQQGCAANQRDTDGDGVLDSEDQCPDTIVGSEVNAQGCAADQRDTDGDGVLDSLDLCPGTTWQGDGIDADGCAPDQRDTDGDGVLDSQDQCPGTPIGTEVNATGCDDYIYKDVNGITIKAREYALINDRKIIDGKEYVVVDESTLRQMIASGEDVTLAVTTFVTSMSGLFQNNAEFNLDISNWDVSNVNDMFDMFNGATAFNQPIGVWDVSKVVNMQGMFQNAHSFNQPIGSWNVSNVQYMYIMFERAYSFNQPIDSWNVSNVIGMEAMFGSATSFNQPLNSWDTSSVTSMAFMFIGAESFNQDLSNWNTASVYTMDSMFNGALLFNQNLSSWCVELIQSEPSNFSSNSSLEAANKPIWGTCPGG
ncbi:surface protein [Muriicola jejuensis]|uniref:BspA family leucine-rich repeat surface protein n=1 Tax=Muriicola jejuensis TaxID=504488 RepID=A0A6P0U9P8_9FLAO|nr:BspA family leucine-rich repeat surface protein [Muriicola jejuensis]NER10021.1 BspA family leucine-rich repeat surface protein [Muriicola jejuensis]SMP03708.1 surface protein [Muriicola jejuensis]